MAINEKVCSKCGAVKPLGHFNKDSSKPSGYYSSCRSCNKARAVEYSSLNSAKIAQRGMDHYLANKEEINKARKEEYKVPINLFKRYQSRVKHLYGISANGVMELMNKQRGCCGVCGESLVYPDSARSYCIDHDHSSMLVRGLLCPLCNTGIGALGDNLSSLQKAVEYLKRTEL